MKPLTTTFIKGFLFLLPPAITLAILYWMASTAEALLKIPLLALLPEGQYKTGMGVAFALVLIFFVGLLVQAYVLAPLFKKIERWIERIPLVKSLYSSTKDLITFMAGSQNSHLQKVVAITYNDHIRVMGFVTAENITLGQQQGLLAVYVPLSYAIGGFVVYVPRHCCEFLPLSPHQAMQIILTAHIQRQPPAA